MTSVDEPMFGYMGKQHIKVYRPCSQMRFLYAGDFGDNYCFGLEQLPAKGDLLFITGGEKDVMSPRHTASMRSVSIRKRLLSLRLSYTGFRFGSNISSSSMMWTVPG